MNTQAQYDQEMRVFQHDHIVKYYRGFHVIDGELLHYWEFVE